jgi:ABC-2 type transport system ATP-binding protein
VHKLQMAFEREIEESDLGFECLLFERVGRVVRVVVRGDLEEIMRAVEKLKPLFVEEIEVDFEELFVSEIKSRGYIR